MQKYDDIEGAVPRVSLGSIHGRFGVDVRPMVPHAHASCIMA